MTPDGVAFSFLPFYTSSMSVSETQHYCRQVFFDQVLTDSSASPF